MSYEILEGQTRKYRQGGTLAVGVTDTVPEAQFLKRTGVGDEYTVITTSVPVVFINLIPTDRGDVVAGGVTVLAGPYEIVTDVYDSSASYSVDVPLTVKQVDGSVSGILTVAEHDDYIHGWVLQAPVSGNGNKLRARMCATNDGVKS